MASLNKVILIGNLGRDPEVRGDERKIVAFSLATSERWTDKRTGEKREKTEWSSIVVFNEVLAAVAESYLRKGSKVYVEGQLQTRKWKDKEGADRYTTEVVLNQFNSRLILLDRRGPGTPDEVEASEETPLQRKPRYDDEIPF